MSAFLLRLVCAALLLFVACAAAVMVLCVVVLWVSGERWLAVLAGMATLALAHETVRDLEKMR